MKFPGATRPGGYSLLILSYVRAVVLRARAAHLCKLPAASAKDLVCKPISSRTSQPYLRINPLSAGRLSALIEALGPGRTKFYPLPQSTARQYMRLRPEDRRINPFTPDHYERQELDSGR